MRIVRMVVALAVVAGLFCTRDEITPSEVGFYDTPDYAYGVAVLGGYAYVADGDSGLRIIRIAR